MERPGIWHSAHPAEISWADFAVMVARRAGLDTGLVQKVPTASMVRPALRPQYSALASERGMLLPPLENAVDRFLTERVGF